ncbi:MAG: hypothetical protein C0613_15615 [Desulfobulbaceae bacterium]|nr:MAG: hypothetical protein C0613_15615 [Desulfobulbaceae bacterium]
MALLTLRAGGSSPAWPRIETRLTRLAADWAPVSRNRESRSYHLSLPQDHHAVTYLQDLQRLLASESVSFFIDLQP